MLRPPYIFLEPRLNKTILNVHRCVTQNSSGVPTVLLKTIPYRVHLRDSFKELVV